MARFFALFTLLLLVSKPGFSQDSPLHFVDWLQPGVSAYQDLKQGAAQAGLSGWVVDRLNQNSAVPQASARDLMGQILASPTVAQDLKARLQADLPSETSQFQDHRDTILGKVQDLQQRMDSLDKQVGEVEKSFAKNNYGPYSSPLDAITMVSSADFEHWAGLEPAQWGGPGVALEDTFNGTTGVIELLLQSGSALRRQCRGGQLTTPSMITDYPYLGDGSKVTLLVNQGWLAGTQVELGMEYFGFSHLLFSGPGFRPQSPFFLGVDAATIGETAPSGQRTVQGLMIQKQGQAGWWWPFTNTQIVLEPLYLGGENNPYLPYTGPFTQHANEFAARLDLAGLNFIPGTQDSIPYLMADITESDQAQLNGFKLDDPSFTGVGVPETDQAYGFGLTTQLAGGGQVLFEAADSDWKRQDSVQGVTGYDKHFTDQALSLDYTDTFGPINIGLEASQVGPYFITGGHEGYASGNEQAGSTFDSTLEDPRPGNFQKTSWEQLSLDPADLSNNSQRAFLNGTWLGSWTTLQLSGGVSKNVNPTGPWVRASEYFDNNQNNGYSWFNMFGEHYSYFLPGQPGGNAAMAQYNNTTLAPAYYHGQPVAYPTVPSSGIPFGVQQPNAVYWTT